MAVNKVVMNTENGAQTLIDLTGDTVTPETLAAGATAHDASGNEITGTLRNTIAVFDSEGAYEDEDTWIRINYSALTHIGGAVRDNEEPLVGDYVRDSDGDLFVVIGTNVQDCNVMRMTRYDELISQINTLDNDFTEELNKKADKTAIPTKTSQLTNDSKFLTAVPSEYVTETELNNKGYLTSHQDISGKADKSSAETWTFKLKDGTTVTKKVVLA